ncbi:MAG: RNA polymerase subunit sigma [Acidobacteria bacterium]|nr:RNA polymerase subunit sigma [Acidobacteriota bacterium]
MSRLSTLGRPLIDALRSAQGLVLVVTGAGISVASGIKTFRGSEPDAVWRQNDVANATVASFERDPVGQLDWYLDRFAAVDDAVPNAGHLALADLELQRAERDLPYLLVTQNIDTLHEQAGSRNLIKVHGSADRLRCGRYGCRLGAPSGSLSRSRVDLETFRRSPEDATLPRCPECGSPLRAHVLFFDEYYTEHDDYRFPEVEQAAAEAVLMLFVGTSFAVGVTSLLLEAGARRRQPMFSIDPVGTRLPASIPVESLTAPAEELLPVVVLGAG